MSEDAWRESATIDVLFPDDLASSGVLVVTSPPIDAAETDTDSVEYGVVAELDGDRHGADYVVCPLQLRSLIADAWRSDEDRAVMEILETDKGPRDDDEWEIDGRIVEDGDPL
jgi:hypothetical protein